MDAENQKAECGREHHRKAMIFQDAEKKLFQLEEKYRRYIIKSRPYFEVKAQCDQMLTTQKERVEYLQKAIKDAKHNYSSSLRILEDISNKIHQQRKDNGIIDTKELPMFIIIYVGRKTYFITPFCRYSCQWA